MAALADDISSIRSSASQLNTLAGQANALIAQTEKILEEIKPGVEIKLTDHFYERRLKNSNGHLVDGWYTLGYGRDQDDDKFALVVITEAQLTEDDGNGGVTKLEDNYGPQTEIVSQRKLEKESRTVRIKAVADLPSLIKMLKTELANSVDETTKSIDAIKSALSEMITEP